NEGLASMAECFFVQPGCWLPEFRTALDLVVLDAGSLGEIDAPTRSIFLRQLQEITADAGIHVIMPGSSGLVPEALLGAYDGWTQDEVARSRRRGAARKSAGIVLTRPSGGEEATASRGAP